MGFTQQLYHLSPPLIQNVFISAYGYQWKKRRFGGVFSQEYYSAKERENYTSAQWLDYQDQRLQAILQFAIQHVPYYRTSFTHAGLTQASLKSITPATIHRLPTLHKEDLRRYGTTTLLSDRREKGGDFFSSSGSTGTPTHILFSRPMHQRWMALFEQRVRNWAGVSSHIARGMIGGRRVIPVAEAKPPFYRYNLFEKQVYFSAYHISRKHIASYLEGMQRYRVEYMTGYAMSNFFLAAFLQENQLQAPPLKAVITSSEKLTDTMRKLFTEVYGCSTYDSWSGVEACGLITECEHGSLHVSPDAGLLEILDDNMQPVGPGQPGEVYCTGFINFDQPLIRYRIGDSIILSDKNCKCGRSMPVVKEILGRNEDIVVGRDGRAMVRFHSIFNGLSSVKQAQVIQENTDAITIKILPAGRLDQREEQLMRDRICSQLGRVDIRFECVDSIPLNSNGKYQAVVSKVKAGQFH